MFAVCARGALHLHIKLYSKVPEATSMDRAIYNVVECKIVNNNDAMARPKLYYTTHNIAHHASTDNTNTPSRPIKFVDQKQKEPTNNDAMMSRRIPCESKRSLADGLYSTPQIVDDPPLATAIARSSIAIIPRQSLALTTTLC